MPKDIMHIGVLGMRWGRRKGRTSDSSSADHTRVSSLKKKKLNELSNEELKTFNTRKNLEKQYKTLNPSKLASGAKTVGKVLAVIGTITAAAATIKNAAAIGKSIYDKIPKASVLEDFVI